MEASSRLMDLHHPQVQVHQQHPLMEANVDLEEESINFWATLGVTPHVPISDLAHQLAHQVFPQKHHHIDPSELPEPPPPPPPPPPALPVAATRYDPLFATDVEPFVGMEFESGEAAKTFYIAYAGRVGFSVRIARSRRSKCTESVIMLRFVCSREGFSREKKQAVPPGKKTRRRPPSVREGCQAMLEVSRRRASTGTGEAERWIVTKLVKEHNHEVGLLGRIHYISTEGDAEVDPYVGMEFDSLDAAKTFYYTYANRVGFEARVRQSRRSLHDESLKMLKLVCSKHRYHSSGKDNNVSSTNGGFGSPPSDPSLRESNGCEALFEIIRKEGDVWVVSKLVLEHTHELAPDAPQSKIRCVRSQGEILVIAKNFADTRNLLLNNAHELSLPKEIRYNDLGPDDFDRLLEHFSETRKENPAFFYAVQIDDKKSNNNNNNNNRTGNVFWADGRARMAYRYFGDTVRFETRYINDKELIPLVFFVGLNHNARPVVFGYGLVVDESEESFAWLFQNWISAMPGNQPPVSFVTEVNNKSIATAAARVFPDTCHIFCSEHVLGLISEELHESNMENNTAFIEEMKNCIQRSETVEAFESRWVMITERFGLRDNAYICYLYEIRQKWAPVYTKGTFTGDIFGAYRVNESLNNIVKLCTVRTQLKTAVQQLSNSIANWHERDHDSDFITFFENPTLHTASPIEKQAAGIYSRCVFERFQHEFMQSFGYYAENISDENGTQFVRKYRVVHSYDESVAMHDVTFSLSEGVRVFCTCYKFKSSGILCRHSLKVFLVEGIRYIPREYVLKRWTRHAKSDMMILDADFVEIKGRNCKYDNLSVSRYNSLCADAVRCVREGSKSDELYKVAKEAIQKAYDEVISVKSHKQQNYMVQQKINLGMKRSGSPTSLTDDDIR